MKLFSIIFTRGVDHQATGSVHSSVSGGIYTGFAIGAVHRLRRSMRCIGFAVRIGFAAPRSRSVRKWLQIR